MATIPATHIDLLQRPVHAVLSTLMPDGLPQSSIVWVDTDGQYVLLNTTLERQKGRNMQRNPRVTLLVVDPSDTSRWIEIRGRVVDMAEEGAEAHADKLARRYAGKERFYGDIYPVERRGQETRVIVKVAPVKVSLDAVFR